jgi:putative restriction endonuclease
MAINPLERTRLEKAAADCGFERTPEWAGDALVLCSSSFPETVTVQVLGREVFILTASSVGVLPGMAQFSSVTHSVGEASVHEPATGCTVQGWQALYQALDKSAATARTLPNRVAQKFQCVTINMPQSTEAERWVVQRVGQDLFRAALLDYWQGRCCVTGLAMPELLRASHIKPWALCNTDEERLDVFNGLLLAPHLDALFDGGWLTVQPDGSVWFSTKLAADARQLLGIKNSMSVLGLTAAHQHYLEFHRSFVFKS